MNVARRSVLKLGLASVAAGTTTGRRAFAAAGEERPRLRRGMNIHHMLNWPLVEGAPEAPDYVWPPFADPGHAMADAEMRRLAGLGFDYVRLTFDPAILAASTGPRRTQLIDIAKNRMQRFNAAGLSVILDFAPVSQDPRFKPEVLVDAGHPDVFARYVQGVADMAAGIDQLPHDRIAFELFNEPPLTRTGDLPRWQAMLERLHGAARAVAPRLPLVINGMHWDDPAQLQQLDLAPFRGSNVFYTFHYYGPLLFTHQGVEGLFTRDVRGLSWPASAGAAASVMDKSMAAVAAAASLDASAKVKAAGKLRSQIDAYFAAGEGARQIEDNLDGVARWAAQNGIPADRVIMGEFNVVRRADMSEDQLAGRTRWLTTVRQAAERRGFPWSYWAYRGYGGMAIADDAPDRAIYMPDIEALGLRPA